MSIASGRTSEIPAFRVAPLWEKIKRHRRSAPGKRPPQDIQSLLSLFRQVQLEDGHRLGYLRVGSRERGWIWPYAVRQAPGADVEPPAALAEIPLDRLASGRLHDDMRTVIRETLNRHFVWQKEPLAMLEYGLLVRELWSLRSESQEADWLALDFLLSRHTLRRVLRRAGRATIRSSLDGMLDPRVEGEGGSGRITLVAYLESPWPRILEIGVQVEPDGWVSWSPGKVLLNLAG